MTDGVSLCDPHPPPLRRLLAARYPALISSWVFLIESESMMYFMMNSLILLKHLCEDSLEPLLYCITTWLNYSWQPGYVQVGGDQTSRSVHTRLTPYYHQTPWPRSTGAPMTEGTRVVCDGFGEDVCGLPWLHMSCVLQPCTLHNEKSTWVREQSQGVVGVKRVCVCECFQLPNVTWLSCGLTLAESPQVVNALLAHITHLSPLEALLGEGVIPSFGKLQADRRVTVSSQIPAF